jgi:hypothetical protein
MTDKELMPLVNQFVTVVLPIKAKISLSFRGELGKSNHEPPRYYLGGTTSILFTASDVNAIEEQDGSGIIRLNE